MSTFSVGFIGLGHMGAAIARRLLSTGRPLVVHDVRMQPCIALEREGATVAGSVSQLADNVDVAFLCLPSAEAGRDVVRELVGGQRVRVVVESSTVGPAALVDMAEHLARHGIELIDAPVSGGPPAAEAGKLSLMYAGEADATARVLPLFEAIAGRCFNVGVKPGLAQVCKLVNNAISAAGMIAACEATVVGVKAGLDPVVLLDAINAGSGRNAATLDKFPRAILPGTFDWGGPMGLMLKDLSLFIEQARACGVPTAMAPATLNVWQEAVDRNGFEADLSRVIRHLEIDAGVEVRGTSRANAKRGA
jgi:3-hydroxyisobutyrate dehydrogenase-like beta-hydroxyacid dehydrogenase